jgi:hypothetical protein
MVCETPFLGRFRTLASLSRNKVSDFSQLSPDVDTQLGRDPASAAPSTPGSGGRSHRPHGTSTAHAPTSTCGTSSNICGAGAVIVQTPLVRSPFVMSVSCGFGRPPDAWLRPPPRRPLLDVPIPPSVPPSTICPVELPRTGRPAAAVLAGALCRLRPPPRGGS